MGDQGFCTSVVLNNYNNSDGLLHITFSYKKTEYYFLKIIINEKKITTFIKPSLKNII